MLDTFSNEFIIYTMALSIVDGEGNDDRRTARILATITSAINNALRLSGRNVPETLYRTEESFMPAAETEKRTPKPWSSVAQTLGFK